MAAEMLKDTPCSMKVFDILRGVHYNGFCSMVYEGQADEMTAIPPAARFLRKMVRGD